MLNMYNGSRRRGAYREWRKEVTAFMMAFQIPKEQQAPRVWLRLAGEAKDAVEHLDMITDLADEKGLETLLKVLDAEFIEEECDRVDEAVSYFWNLRREYGQSMETYLSIMHQAKMRMKKEDPTTTIGDKAYAVRLLRKAGLNRDEQQQILSATNAEYDAKKIETALKRLFKNIATSDKGRSAFRPKFNGKGHGKKGSYKGTKSNSSGSGKGFRPFSGTYAAEQYDIASADDEAYYEDDGAEEDDEDEEDWYENIAGIAEEDDDDEEEDEELVDAMVAYQSAKHRLAKAKKAGQRGWTPKPSKGKGGGKGGDSLADKKAKSRCADCGQIGHWHGDEACEKVKRGEVQAFRGKKGSGKSKGGRDGYYVEAYTVDSGEFPEPGDWVMTPWPQLDAHQINTVFEVAPIPEHPQQIDEEDDSDGPPPLADSSSSGGPQPLVDSSSSDEAYLATPLVRPKANLKAAPTKSAAAAAAAAPVAKAVAKAKAVAAPPPPPKATAEQIACPHDKVRAGSNQYISWRTCTACNWRLDTGPPKEPKAKSKAATTNDCLHANFRTGSNQYIAWKTCTDCETRLETNPPKAPKSKSTPEPPPTKASRSLPSAAAATDAECPHTNVRRGANQYTAYVTCTLCGVRLSTTPKAKSFVGLAEVLMNDRDTSREEDESEEAKARSQAEVMDLITKISEDNCLVMTAEIEDGKNVAREGWHRHLGHRLQEDRGRCDLDQDLRAGFVGHGLRGRVRSLHGEVQVRKPRNFEMHAVLVLAGDDVRQDGHFGCA